MKNLIKGTIKYVKYGYLSPIIAGEGDEAANIECMLVKEGETNSSIQLIIEPQNVHYDIEKLKEHENEKKAGISMMVTSIFCST